MSEPSYKELFEENLKVSEENTKLKLLLEDKDTRTKKKPKISKPRTIFNQIPKRTVALKRFEAFLAQISNSNKADGEFLDRGMYLSKLNCLSVFIADKFEYNLNLIKKETLQLVGGNLLKDDEFQWIYKIYIESSSDWIQNHARMEENLKGKIWNLIFEVLFSKIETNHPEIIFFYEFKLNLISTYKHFGFADYATVVWSGKKGGKANPIFLGEVSFDTELQTQMHKDWKKLALELAASLLATAGQFRENFDVLQKLRCFGALIGGLTIELCFAYLDFNIEAQRFSVIFKSSSNFLKFDLLDNSSLSKKFELKGWENYLTKNVPNEHEKDVIVIDSSPEFEQNINPNLLHKTGTENETYINTDIALISSNDTCTLINPGSQSPSNDNLNQFSKETLIVLQNFVSCIKKYGIWLRGVLNEEANNLNTNDDDSDDNNYSFPENDSDYSESDDDTAYRDNLLDFHFPKCYDHLSHATSRSSHSANSPKKKISESRSIFTNIIPSSPCPPPHPSTKKIEIIKPSNRIEKMFYTDPTINLSIFKPRLYNCTVFENDPNEDGIDDDQNQDQDQIRTSYTMEFLLNGWDYFKLRNHPKYESFKFLLNGFCALYYIHSAGYIHGDVSPNNIRYSTIDQVWKLIDFEQSMLKKKSISLTRRGGTSGFRGENLGYDKELGGRFDEKSDILSLILTFEYFWPEFVSKTGFFAEGRKFRNLISSPEPNLIQIIQKLLKQFSKINRIDDFVTIREAAQIVSDNIIDYMYELKETKIEIEKDKENKDIYTNLFQSKHE